MNFLSHFFCFYTKLKLRKIFFFGGGAKFFEILEVNFFVFRWNWNWEKIIFWNNLFGGFFLGGGVPYPNFFGHESSILGQIRLPPEFQLPRQTTSGRKVHGRKEKEERRTKKERIMPSLVATTSALTHTTCVRTHYICTKIRDSSSFNFFLFQDSVSRCRAFWWIQVNSYFWRKLQCQC